jgi:hypothetical protein
MTEVKAEGRKVSTAEAVVDRLYSRFLNRDLIYAVAGCGVLAAAHAMWPPNAPAGIPCFDCWQQTVAFVALGYIVGVVLHESAVWVGWMHMYPGEDNGSRRFVDSEVEAIKNLIELDACDPPKSPRVDRITHLKSFGATVGVAAGVVFLLALVSWWSGCKNGWDWRLSVALGCAIAMPVCTVANQRKAEVQHKLLEQLTKKE